MVMVGIAIRNNTILIWKTAYKTVSTSRTMSSKVYEVNLKSKYTDVKSYTSEYRHTLGIPFETEKKKDCRNILLGFYWPLLNWTDILYQLSFNQIQGSKSHAIFYE